MKLLTCILPGFLLCSVAHAATVIVSSTAPVVDGADIANLSGNSDAGGDQGHIWSNRPHQGQTFTTGSNTLGYELSSLTLRNRNNTVGSTTFNVLVGTISGTTMTQIGSTETGASPSYVPNDYITFTFDTPLVLNPTTTYGFLWGTNGQGFVTANNLNDSTYTGGTAISSGDNNIPNLANVISRNVDRVFHADITAISAIPEPSSSTLLGLGGLALMLRRRR